MILTWNNASADEGRLIEEALRFCLNTHAPFQITDYKSSRGDHAMLTLRFMLVPYEELIAQALGDLEEWVARNPSHGLARLLGVPEDVVQEALADSLEGMRRRLAPEGLEVPFEDRVVFHDESISLLNLESQTAYGLPHELEEQNFRSDETRVKAYIRSQVSTHRYYGKLILKPGKFSALLIPNH